MFNTNHKSNIESFWLSASGSEIATLQGQLLYGVASRFAINSDDAIKIGSYNSSPVYWIPSTEYNPPENIEYRSVRDFLTIDKTLFHLASKAVQLESMFTGQRFCSICGGRNHFHHRELSMQCGECQTLHYPRIYPCIIVAVVKDQQILLARHHRHSSAPFFTVLAGYTEVGETLEECVHREVYEETSIKVKNLTYLGSQPWAVSNSLMVAFIADYDSGEINIDDQELAEADWYSFDRLPKIAPIGTIARKLIDTVTNNKC